MILYKTRLITRRFAGGQANAGTVMLCSIEYYLSDDNQVLKRNS